MLDDGADLENVAGYRWLVGMLIYLAVTRPDFSYSVRVITVYEETKASTLGSSIAGSEVLERKSRPRYSSECECRALVGGLV